MDIDKIIRESIDEFLSEGLVDKFTPYSPEEAKVNHDAALGKGINSRPLEDRNKSYGDFMAWKKEGIAKGVPPKELSWANYVKNR